MKETFFGALSPLLMLFLCIMAGFILKKLKLMPDSTASVLSNCEKYLFMPALGYATFSKYCTVLIWDYFRKHLEIRFLLLLPSFPNDVYESK